MQMNPNLMLELARMRQEELLVKAEKARLVRRAVPDRHAPMEPPPDVNWRRSTA
jgi:hypothetical protein